MSAHSNHLGQPVGFPVPDWEPPPRPPRDAIDGRYCGLELFHADRHCGDLFAAYARVSGRAVDPAVVRFWEAWGSVKWGVMCLMKGQAHRRTARERTVEAFAIGRRMEEPIHDFLSFIGGDH